MPNDYITQKAVASELNELLTDGKINKINFDSANLFMSIRAKGNNYTLLTSVDVSQPGFYISDIKPDPYLIPSAFCMLLRKYLTNSTIQSIEMLNNDRIMALTVIAKDELRDSTKYTLITEIMGSASNMILVDNEFKIIDAYKRIYEEKNNRQVIPFTKYIFPAKNKIAIDDNSLDSKIQLNLIQSASDLLNQISGISKETATEIIERSKDVDLITVLKLFSNVFNSKSYSPSLCEQNGNIVNFFIMPYISISGNWIKTPSLNHAINKYYFEKYLIEKKRKDSKEVSVLLKRHKTQIDKKINDATDKANKEDELNQTLKRAEILKCNIFKLKDLKTRLPAHISCFDYDNNQDIDLVLDQKLSAKENVEMYYKKYNKLKGAVSYAKKELIELRVKAEYINSIEVAIENSTTREEYSEIKKEIQELIGVKSVNNKKNPTKKDKKTKPYSTIIDGFTIYIGKNNYQNDMITFDIASSRDLWLHVKNYHSGHGIILTDGRAVPISIITKVAQHVAFMSKAKDSDKVEVDYTLRKHVKKLGKPGLVTYTDNKTIQVKPLDFINNLTIIK
ncbi:MAG: NFACT family protein [Christensenellaceae bacterium]|jgi:predicted ribosome quality control (RQC) complex YloA/Tae2 family protein|nr:NFACT family protein [Christensenellaceae bacterium]